MIKRAKDKLKKYFGFDKKEVIDLIITTIIVGFIFSFKDWGTSALDVATGMRNFLNATLIVGLAYLVHETAHKLTAIRKGYEAKYQMWFPGLLISLVATVVLASMIPDPKIKIFFILPGAVIVSAIPLMRVGHYEPFFTYKDNAIIAYMGPLANICLALLFKIAGSIMFVNQTLVQQAMMINAWLAVLNMLPIPPLDGSKVFFGSRMFYMFGIGLIISAAILMFYTSTITTIISSITLGIVTAAIGYFTLEK